MSDPYIAAEAALESLESFGGQIEEGARDGNLGMALGHAAIASALLAVADTLRSGVIGVRDVDRI